MAPVYGRATPSLRLAPPAILVDGSGQLGCRSSMPGPIHGFTVSKSGRQRFAASVGSHGCRNLSLVEVGTIVHPPPLTTAINRAALAEYCLHHLIHNHGDHRSRPPPKLDRCKPQLGTSMTSRHDDRARATPPPPARSHMTHFFTADTHFTDDPVRRFFRRPFASVEAMDAAMITRAGIVGADDDLWIIGDFAACETEAGRRAAQAAFGALPGRKHLVRGNHDPDWLAQALPWASVHDLGRTRHRRSPLCPVSLSTGHMERCAGRGDPAFRPCPHPLARRPGPGECRCRSVEFYPCQRGSS